ASPASVIPPNSTPSSAGAKRRARIQSARNAVMPAPSTGKSVTAIASTRSCPSIITPTIGARAPHQHPHDRRGRLGAVLLERPVVDAEHVGAGGEEHRLRALCGDLAPSGAIEYSPYEPVVAEVFEVMVDSGGYEEKVTRLERISHAIVEQDASTADDDADLVLGTRRVFVVACRRRELHVERAVAENALAN